MKRFNKKLKLGMAVAFILGGSAMGTIAYAEDCKKGDNPFLESDKLGEGSILAALGNAFKWELEQFSGSNSDYLACTVKNKFKDQLDSIAEVVAKEAAGYMLSLVGVPESIQSIFGLGGGESETAALMKAIRQAVNELKDHHDAIVWKQIAAEFQVAQDYYAQWETEKTTDLGLGSFSNFVLGEAATLRQAYNTLNLALSKYENDTTSQKYKEDGLQLYLSMVKLAALMQIEMKTYSHFYNHGIKDNIGLKNHLSDPKNVAALNDVIGKAYGNAGPVRDYFYRAHQEINKQYDKIVNTDALKDLVKPKYTNRICISNCNPYGSPSSAKYEISTEFKWEGFDYRFSCETSYYSSTCQSPMVFSVKDKTVTYGYTSQVVWSAPEFGDSFERYTKNYSTPLSAALGLYQQAIDARRAEDLSILVSYADQWRRQYEQLLAFGGGTDNTIYANSIKNPSFVTFLNSNKDIMKASITPNYYLNSSGFNRRDKDASFKPAATRNKSYPITTQNVSAANSLALVTVDISHERPEDLVLQLVHPDGEVETLRSRQATVCDTSEYTSTQCVAIKKQIKETFVVALTDKSKPNGTYYLRYIDSVSGGVGLLNSYSILFK